MAWLMALICAVAMAGGKAVPFPTATTVVTSDGVNLAAEWGAPAGAQNGVVLVHGAGGTKDEWALFADKCARSGLMVLTFDLRGHGANRGTAPVPLTAADYTAMAKDVAAAAAHLRAAGATKIALVGSELGANLTLNAAADDASVSSVALLSAGLSLNGVVTPDAIRRYGARPVLFVASRDDAYGATSASALDAAATGEHRLQLYDAAGKGTRMFNREPGLESVLIGFLGSHWTAVAAPVVTTPQTVNIKVATPELKTTGPVTPDVAP